MFLKVFSLPSLFSRFQKKTSREEKIVEIRIATYHQNGQPPAIEVISSPSIYKLINETADNIYAIVNKLGGKIPYISIREIVENLLHAEFCEVVVSIMNNGNMVRIADQGSGIPDKNKVFENGFSTASAKMRSLIKGVGSGLPTARDALEIIGGSINIEDNLRKGTVVTLFYEPSTDRPEPVHEEKFDGLSTRLSERQKKILLLFSEGKETGPSKVAQTQQIGLSTAYRELVFLEKEGLITSNELGKRSLTPAGLALLHHLSK